jgi:hypothetical protein
VREEDTKNIRLLKIPKFEAGSLCLMSVAIFQYFVMDIIGIRELFGRWKGDFFTERVWNKLGRQCIPAHHNVVLVETIYYILAQ